MEGERGIMDILKLGQYSGGEMRRLLPKPSIVHKKGEKEFIVDTNYLPFLYLLALICIASFLLFFLELITPWTFVLANIGLLVVLITFGLGYRYEFKTDGITCSRLKPEFRPAMKNNYKGRRWAQLKRFDGRTVSQAEVLQCKHTVYIRVAFAGCEPFTEPWIWLHLVHNMGNVLILRIRKEEKDRAYALLRNYFYGENLPVCDVNVEKKKTTTKAISQEKIRAANTRWIWFSLMCLLLSLAAIPVFGRSANQDKRIVDAILDVIAFAPFVISFLSPYRRQIMIEAVKRMISRNTYREMSTKRKWVFGLLCLLNVVVFGITAYCMHQLDVAGGGPWIYQGVYCIWNHRFIREITVEEYRFLCMIENLDHAFGRAVFPTIPLIIECFTSHNTGEASPP